MLEITDGSLNSRTKLPRPSNRVGGSSAFTRKNDCTMVNTAGTSANPTMKITTGATNR